MAVVQGYVIEWSKDGEEQAALILGNVNEYTFTDLMPGQSISASVCAFPNLDLFRKQKYSGRCSDRQRAVLSDVDYS